MASSIKKSVEGKSGRRILDLVVSYESIETGMEKNIYKWAIIKKTGLTEEVFDKFIEDPETFIRKYPQYFI
jgi:hypothetical protein